MSYSRTQRSDASATLWSQVMHSTTESLCSLTIILCTISRLKYRLVTKKDQLLDSRLPHCSLKDGKWYLGTSIDLSAFSPGENTRFQ